MKEDSRRQNISLIEIVKNYMSIKEVTKSMISDKKCGKL